jgi:FkbM family methyltransferase
MDKNREKIRRSLTSILAYNPLKQFVFRVTGKRISFNHLTIRIIAFFLRQRIPFYGSVIDVSSRTISPLTKSLLYYGLYEQNEVRLVKKYLREDDDVIELGASIGVIGSVLSRIQTTGRYVAVEADPTLADIIAKNLSINRTVAYTLVSKAIDYTKETVSFAAGGNTLAGKLINDDNGKNAAITVDTITLDEICTGLNLAVFTLICDIEGAEIGLLLNDDKALANCEKMIIELHETQYDNRVYPIREMVELILAKKYEVLDNCGNVFVFAKMR